MTSRWFLCCCNLGVTSACLFILESNGMWGLWLHLSLPGPKVHISTEESLGKVDRLDQLHDIVQQQLIMNPLRDLCHGYPPVTTTPSSLLTHWGLFASWRGCVVQRGEAGAMVWAFRFLNTWHAQFPPVPYCSGERRGHHPANACNGQGLSQVLCSV